MNKNELLVAVLSKRNSAAVHAAAHGCCQCVFNPQTLAKWRAKTELVLCSDGCKLKRQQFSPVIERRCTPGCMHEPRRIHTLRDTKGLYSMSQPITTGLMIDPLLPVTY